MSAISLKSITGITSITTPAGVDNQLTLHNNNTSEAVKLDVAGNVHINNQLAVTGVSTFRDIDVDGHTNLDNVSIAGLTTITGTGQNGLLQVSRASGASLYIQAQTALGVFGTTSNHNVRIISNGNERMMFSTSGNVGINESSPPQRLTVGGDIQIGFNNPNDAGRQLNFNVDRSSAGQTLANINWQWNNKFVAQIRGIAGSDTQNKDDAHLAFFTSSANNLTERLRVTSTGVVGITTDASGNGSGAKLVVGGRVQSNNGGYWFADANGAENGWHVQDSGGNLIIVESGVAERLRIGSSGQIGLGGANYGSSGQVLTSGGSGSAASWTTVSGTTINNNADNRLITGSGTANTLNAEADITYDGTILALAGGKYINCSSPYRVAGHPVLGYDSFTDISGGSYATRIGSTGTSTLRSTQIYGGGSHLATFDGVNSRLGLRTTTPAKDLHVYNPSVSTVRIETGDSRGQAWDILSTNGAQNNTGTLSFRDESGASYMEFGANAGSPQFRVRNGGANDLLYIDSSGRVTKPLQPSFYGRGYNGHNSGNWKFDAVASSNGEHNQGSHFNNNTGLFTCPVAGHYFIGGGWGYLQTANYCMMGFRYNGNTQLNLWEDGRSSAGNVHVSASLALVIQCNANDTLSFVSNNSYAEPNTNTIYAWGSIYLVG